MIMQIDKNLKVLRNSLCYNSRGRNFRNDGEAIKF